MLPTQTRRATSAAKYLASEAGLPVDDTVLLSNSNKLVLRLLPSDVLARVAPEAHQIARFEIELAQRLARLGSPVARLDPRVEPRVYAHDGFEVSLWTHYEPSGQSVSALDHADALERLHAGMRQLDVRVPSFTDRVDQARLLLASHDRTPALTDPDRELLSRTLESLGQAIGERGGTEQLVHGEPHPGNILATNEGLLFIDFETCCRAPVEFDLAHLPEEVGDHYPGVDRALLHECRSLVLAMVTTWRWDRDDQFPSGRRLGVEWLSRLRASQL